MRGSWLSYLAIFFYCAVFGAPAAFAQVGPDAINISGALFNSNGTPINKSSVNFKIEVWDQNLTCVLYSEEHLGVNLSSSSGRFSLLLGRGQNAVNSIDQANPTALTFTVFYNSGSVPAFPGCSSGLTLNSGDQRLIRISYDLGVGYVAMNPDVPLSSSAYAMVADSISGKKVGDLVQIRSDVDYSLTQANIENVFSKQNYARLDALLSGSTSFSFNNNRLTNVAAPSVATDAANKSYVDQNIGGKSVDLTGVGPSVGDGKFLVWDATAGKWTTGLPDGASLSNINAIRLQGYSVSAQAPTINQILKWNGSAWTPSQDDGGIAALTGDVSASGIGSVAATITSNAVTTAKIANGAITSAKIAGGATSNLILMTDSLGGSTVTYSTCPNQGEVLKWTTALGWQCSSIASLAPVTSVAGKTGAITLNVNDVDGLGTAAIYDVGVTANQLVQLDASARIPAVDGGLLSNVSAQRLQGKAISTTAPTPDQVLAWNNTSSQWTPTTLSTNFPLLGNLGSASAPTYSFAGDTDTGWFSPAAGILAASTDGVERIRIDSNGNVGIGTTIPGAMLDLVSTTSGFLMPRMTSTQRTAMASPATGLQVYDTTGNQIYYYNGTAWQALGVAGVGVNSITAGTGLTGGTITNTGTISLADTAVTAGSYGSATQVPTFTVDAQGRLTTAANVTISGTSPVGSTLTGGQIWVGNSSNVATAVALGGDATLSNTGSLTLANSGATAGSYTKVTVDAKGRVTNGTGLALTDMPSMAANTLIANATGSPAVPTAVTLSALLDSGVSSTQGSVLYRSNTGWTALAAGTSGQFLQTQGAAANPQWATPAPGPNVYVNGGNSFGANATIGLNDNFDLGVKTNNATRMTITAAGNVGIGTTSPSAKLEAAGTIQSNTGGLLLTTQGRSWPKIGLFPNDLGNWGRGDLVFAINNVQDSSSVGISNEVMRLTSDGNLLIGTTSSSSVLAVAGTRNGWSANIVGVDIAPTLQTTSLPGLTQTGVSITPAFTNFQGVGVGRSLYIKGTADSTAINNTYALYVDAPTGGANNYAAVFNGGNVGIGTTSPVAKLEVASGTSGISGLKFTNFNSGTGTSTGQPVGVDASGNLVTISVSGSGTVNTGTANQMAFYSSSGSAVSGNANVTANNGVLSLGQVGSVIGGLNLNGNTSGTVSINPQATAGTYNFNLPTTAGTSGQVLTSGGGVAAPMTWTSLAASATSDTTNASNITSGTLNIARFPALSSGQFWVGNASNVATAVATSTDTFTQYALLAGRTGGQTLYGGIAASNSLTLESTSNGTKGNVLLAPSGGNVGIGTTSPGQKLDVNGSVKLTGNLVSGSSINIGNESTYLSLGGNSSSDPAYTSNQTIDIGGSGINGPYTHTVNINANTNASADSTYVTNIGNQNYGGASKINIQGDIYNPSYNGRGSVFETTYSSNGVTILSAQTGGWRSYLQFASGSLGTSTTLGYVGMATSDSVLRLSTNGSMPVAFGTNGSERMRIDTSGNVGIGTTSPGSKLSVNGTIESTSGGFKFPDGTVQTTAATGGGGGGGSGTWSIVSTNYTMTAGEMVYVASGDSADAFFNNNKLLMHFDGANGSTTFTDQMGHTVSATGTAAISTAQSKFGGSSVSLSFNNYLTSTFNADYSMNNQDFTVEMWVYPTAYPGANNALLIDNGSWYGSNQTNYNMGMNSSGNVWFSVGQSSTSNIYSSIGSTASAPLNTWTHLAGVKQGSTITLFVNGVSQGSVVITFVPNNGANRPLYIGSFPNNNGIYFTGYMDEIRITSGTARYTTNFTPSASAYSNTGATTPNLSLPASPSTGSSVRIRTGNSIANVLGNGRTISGSSSISLGAGLDQTLIYDGTVWRP